jgi:DNA-binding NtrC family response regulator
MTQDSSDFVVAVVDDDRSVLRSLEYLLESADYSVRLFDSGAAFLGSACLAGIDCLISDVDMPGIEGFELLRQVQAARPGLPVILITGYPKTLERLPALGCGVHSTLPGMKRDPLPIPRQRHAKAYSCASPCWRSHGWPRC